jgi:hypothetical protein
MLAKMLRPVMTFQIVLSHLASMRLDARGAVRFLALDLSTLGCNLEGAPDLAQLFAP